MASDMARRWREAKLGERRGSLVCVWVECEGDPRAEVLEAIGVLDRVELWQPTFAVAGPPEAFGLPPASGEPADVVVTDVDRETGTVTIASAPKRKRAKRGAE